MHNKPTSYNYRELLQFFETAGVDIALEEQSINRLQAKIDQNNLEIAPSPSPIPQMAQKQDIAAPASLAKPSFNHNSAVIDANQINTAQQIAAQADSLEALRHSIENFDGCALKFTAKTTCFADGTPGSTVMLIGEAPGRDEDIEGRPFVGRSGQLLNKILHAIGLSRDQVYIANTIPWRPPGNRTPTPLETELMRPFIARQIELANPKILIALGGPAANSLGNIKGGILRLRGKWLPYHTNNGTEIPLMPTLHPAYLLRTPAQKKLAWLDFIKIKQKIIEVEGQ